MTIPINFLDINSVFGWILGSLDTNLFGMIGMSALFILAIVFALLVFINANRFALIGFMSTTLFALGVFGYTFFGWIGALGALLAGLLLGMAIVKILGL